MLKSAITMTRILAALSSSRHSMHSPNLQAYLNYIIIIYLFYYYYTYKSANICRNIKSQPSIPLDPTIQHYPMTLRDQAQPSSADKTKPGFHVQKD
jgi:hypothetical protein